MTINWQQYRSGNLYDEMIDAAGQLRPPARVLCDYLAGLPEQELRQRKDAAELAIRVMGITFTVGATSL